MISKNELKSISSLLQKKYRNELSKFIVEGPKLIREAIISNWNCELVIASFLFAEDNPDFISEMNKSAGRVEIVKQPDFEKITDTKNPQGVIGIFHKKNISNTGKKDFIVALENISDPGNLGTILRNCDWFGFEEIILSESCAEIFNPKVIRSSAGSVFHLKISERKNFIESLSELKGSGYKILCSDLNGENIYVIQKPKKSILVLSNEANGPSNELLKISDTIITVPRKGKAESLNVASASAIILSELSR